MAQKVTVTLEDDLTGGPAKQTVRFAFDGSDYEIDLNAKNAAAFGKQLAPYLEHARRVARAQPRRAGRTVANRQRSGDIRAWAKEHGLAVSARGRIPASVVPCIATALRKGDYPQSMKTRPVYHLHRFDPAFGFVTESRIVSAEGSLARDYSPTSIAAASLAAD